MSKPDQEKLPDFEAALSELEALIEKMEQGDLSLDESMRQYERGVKLTRHCQALLEKAELKVQQLGDNDEPDEFDAHADASSEQPANDDFEDDIPF